MGGTDRKSEVRIGNDEAGGDSPQTVRSERSREVSKTKEKRQMKDAVDGQSRRTSQILLTTAVDRRVRLRRL